jgi:hypothetical protein
VALVYESNGPGWPDADSWAVILFTGCWEHRSGGPNDEALRRHPLTSLGLQPYTLQEVVDSPWRVERGRISDKDGDPLRMLGRTRHFIAALKMGMFECLARHVQTLGTFSSLPRAVDAALREVNLPDGTG